MGSFFRVLLQDFDVLAWPIVSLLYPIFASIKAIERRSLVDDRQWLAYWVLYSFIILFDKLAEWIPLWSYVRLIITCWLAIPHFSGASYIYQHFVRQVYLNTQTLNIWYVPREKDIFSEPNNDVLLSAEKFVEENGIEAFQNLLNEAGKEGKGKKHKRVTSEDH